MNSKISDQKEEALVRRCILSLRPYSPGKPIEEVQREYGLTEVVKLASNENPLGPSPRAVEAMAQAIREVRLYPDNECYWLRRELAAQLGVEPDQVIVGRGSDEVIHMLGLAFLEPGDQVMMCDPPFTLYLSTAQLMGAEPVRVPLRDFRHDLAEMSRRLTERTKLVFISNPDNPTGTIVTRREVEAFLADLPARTVVAFDEAYSEYVDDPEFPRSLEYLERHRVFVLRTFSKIYALAGLRVGYGVARSGLMRYLHQVREPFNVSSIAQAAARASLADPGQVERSRRANSEGKRYLYREFERLGLACVPTEANFVLVDAGVDSRLLFEKLLRRGVIVRTGDVFGYPTHIRVTIGAADQNRRFIEALEAEVKGER